jgi:hypothetical protein
VQFFHCRVETFVSQRWHDVGRFVDIFENRGLDFARGILQYVIRYLILVPRVAHTKSQSHEVGAAVPNYIAQTIVSAVAAAEL